MPPARTPVRARRKSITRQKIGDAEAAFLRAALDAQTLDAALAAAQLRDASFDLGLSLSEWVQSRVIVDFELNGE
jgi:hypothetical protein